MCVNQLQEDLLECYKLKIMSQFAELKQVNMAWMPGKMPKPSFQYVLNMDELPNLTLGEASEGRELG